MSLQYPRDEEVGVCPQVTASTYSSFDWPLDSSPPHLVNLQVASMCCTSNVKNDRCASTYEKMTHMYLYYRSLLVYIYHLQVSMTRLAIKQTCHFQTFRCQIRWLPTCHSYCIYSFSFCTDWDKSHAHTYTCKLLITHVSTSPSM